jgi:hypothetical protein
MLAAFFPGPAATTFISAPVSLIDVPSTIRQLLGLSVKNDEGEPLPLDPCSQNARRTTKQLTPLAVASGAKNLMNPTALGFRGNIVYQPDGTYVLSNKLKDEIQHLIERENRTAETLRRILSKNSSQNGHASD